METRICLKCKRELPLSEFNCDNPGRRWYRHECKECERKRRNKSSQERKIEIKRRAIKFLGGKCFKCGYDKCIAALDFHHKNNKRSNKELMSTILKYRKWELVERELKKCVLLCSNCHREFHKIYGFKDNTEQQLKEFFLKG